MQELDYNFSLKLDVGGTNGEFVLCCGGYWVSHLQVVFMILIIVSLLFERIKTDC